MPGSLAQAKSYPVPYLFEDNVLFEVASNLVLSVWELVFKTMQL